MESSTATLTVRVCSCDADGNGNVLLCSAEANTLHASLSRGALIAILACILVLLGERCYEPAQGTKQEGEATQNLG